MYERLGRLPSDKASDPTERSIGKWQGHQRTYYNNNSLSDGRIRALESTPGWAWEVDRFQNQYLRWVDVYQRLGRAPSQRAEDEDERLAGRWQTNVRMAYRDRDTYKWLTDERIMLLEATPNWRWEEPDAFEEQLQNWIAQYQRLGRYPNEHSDEQAEKDAGLWQARMRRAYKNRADYAWLTDVRVARLDATPGWAWEVDKFQVQLEKWGAFYQQHKRTPNANSKNEAEAASGRWQTNVRKAYHNREQFKWLTDGRVAALDNVIGWSWGKPRKAAQ